MFTVRFRINHTTLHVYERSMAGCNVRPTLVFLHYFGGSGRAWAPVMDALASQGWGCLAPDLRGFGNSPAPGKNPSLFSVNAMADDVEALIGKLRLRNFILIGHSMGGKVALALAARQPARLTGVVLLAPSPPTPEPMEAAERQRLLDGFGKREAALETLRKITAHPLPKDFSEAAVGDSLRTSPPAWRAWLEHGSREDISALVPSILAPVRIAVGAADKAITRCLVKREIAERLKGCMAPVVSLPGGHLLPLEAPVATTAFLSEALVHFESQVEQIA